MIKKTKITTSAPKSDWQKLLQEKQEREKASKAKSNSVKGYKPSDNRQVTHNLRRRMGR